MQVLNEWTLFSNFNKFQLSEQMRAMIIAVNSALQSID